MLSWCKPYGFSMSGYSRTFWALIAVAVVCCLSDRAQAQVDWLPDIIIRESNLNDNDIVTNIVPGRRHLRFSNGTPNIGLGRLHLIGVLPPDSNGNQLVLQRISRSDGSFYDDTSGFFIYHNGHSHTHFEDWCAYSIREVLPEDGVGAILGTSLKTSFCIFDLAVHDNTLPNYSPSAFFQNCTATQQGLSVGWYDLYTKSLPGQNIDITDLPDGEYWLEAEVDPENNIVESDDTNNITRVKVIIGGGGTTIPADDFEVNDTLSDVAAEPLGQANSPNLGPCGPRREIDSLSIHVAGNRDYFRFYSNHNGTTSDTVRIDFSHPQGDLDLRLLNSQGNQVRISEGTDNWEEFTLTGLGQGWYFVHVYGWQNATNPYYRLTINPPSNSSPTVSVIDPPVGVTERAHAFQSYTVTWDDSDPEADSTWVTVYLDTIPVFDGDEILLEGSLYTPGPLGMHIINSAAVLPDTYWVYCEITDGGTVTGDWSDGQIAFVTAVDSDGDGLFDFEDNCIGWANPSQNPGCVNHGDPAANGQIDVFDVVSIIDIAFRGVNPIVDADCPHDPTGRTDINCDSQTNIIDVSEMIDVAFRGATQAFCDPCDCQSYPDDCP